MTAQVSPLPSAKSLPFGLSLVASLLAVLLGAAPADAQRFKVGSFTKSTTVAPPGTVTQVVPHGLGNMPKALILWTNRSAANRSFLYAFGMSDGTTSRSVAMASQNGVAPSNSSRRIAAKALTIVQWGQALVAEADLTSWDANNFTLTWTANDGTGDTIHFMVIGGGTVSAKVVDWTMPAAVGNVSVNTVGFQPDVVLHAHAGDDFTAALGTSIANASFSLGAIDKGGNEWAEHVLSIDGVTPANGKRGRVNNDCIYAIDSAAAIQKQGACSMSANGFTVNFTNTTSLLTGRVVSLALKGVFAKAGNFTKSNFSPVPPPYVQSNSFTTAVNVTSANVTLPAVSTTGNVIVVSFDYSQGGGAVASSVVDTNGNTYQRVYGPTDWGTQGDRTYTYYAKNITGGGAAITVTVNLSGGNSNGRFQLYATEYTGVDTVNPLDQASQTIGSGSPLASTAVTTTFQDEVLYAFCSGDTAAITVNAPFTTRMSPNGDPVADASVTSLGTYNVTGTLAGGNWMCHLLSFRHFGVATSVTNMGFSPGAVLLTSIQQTSTTNSDRLGLGAADSAFHQGASALTDETGVNPSSVWGRDTTSRAFVKMNNNTGAIDAEAVLARSDADGFTLGWLTNDGTNTEILYLALGGLAPVGVGCGGGSYPTGANFVQFGTFNSATQTPAGNNFTTSANFLGVNQCPGDTAATIRTPPGAPCANTAILVTQFPGDPLAGVAAANNSLYLNGNNLYAAVPGPYGPSIVWRQTVNGLTQNTNYTFFLYASNVNNPPNAHPNILPTLRFCKGVTGTGPYACATQLNAVDFSIPNEWPQTGDVWRRYQVSLTTGAGETTADLAVLDTASDTNGDDVQITQVGVQTCSATAVTLKSFEAVPSDSTVLLAWHTGSEVDNLGFHLYRGPSADGPWKRLTEQLIPGQGFSAMGADYSWRDTGLVNGTRYFYRLEDVDTQSLSTFHGPVSAMPLAEPAPRLPEGGEGSGPAGGGVGSDGTSWSCPAWALAQLGSSDSYACETHGDPGATSFRVLSRTSRSVLIELETGGFLTARDATGRVRVLVPGFDPLADPLAPALPLKRARLAGLVGRPGRIGAIQARENRFFPGLHAAAVGHPQPIVLPDGTVQADRREAELTLTRGVFPRVQARLAGEGFQGEDKTLALELLPVRYDASRGAMVLSRKLTVRIDFTGVEPSETGRGRLGRRVPRPQPDTNAYAFLGTSQEGLHAVAFEEVFPGRSRPVDLATLRLTRGAGASVPFFVLPQGPSFGSRGRLFFHVDATASSLSFSPEVVYALERGAEGTAMSLVSAPPDASSADSPAVSSRGFASFETNRIFAPDVLDIEDLWQWESIGSGVSKTKPFALDGLDTSSPETARLVVHLQGGSDAVSVADHHVQVFVKGALSPVLVADETFDGAVPHTIEADVPVSLLAATNDLTVTNVGDTGVSSRVFLDRFEMLYPQVTAARSGSFDGVFASAGTAEVVGVAPLALLDVTSGASWLTGFEPGPTLRFRAEAGHRYVAVSQEGLLAPRVFFPEPSARLRSKQNQADYVLVAPKAFLGAAQPLLERREAQGLTTFAASLEEVASSFGGGQPSAEAIHEFLSFAFHQWRRPSPRYVLLLGDANHDPRRFNAASQPSPMPFILQKTSYIWTASDPALAAVNGRRLASRPCHRKAPRHDARAGGDDGRQDPRVGGPGPEPRRQGRPRRRQPRPRRRLRGRRPRHRGVLPRGERDGRDLPRPAAEPRRGPQPDPRRLQPGPLADLLRRPRGRRRLGEREHPQLLRPRLAPRPAASALHAHDELPQRLLHHAVLRVSRRGIPQGTGQGHDRILLAQRAQPRRAGARLPPCGHAGDHRRPAPAAWGRDPRRAEDVRAVRGLPGAARHLPPLRRPGHEDPVAPSPRGRP